jgi:pimeloyl-[acyl-carrier protein] synthase
MTTLKHAAKIDEAEYSLFQLLKPEVIADPYPLYRRLREFEPVHWDPFLHSWVVTSYAECVVVLGKYKAARTPSLEQLEAMGLSVLAPYAGMMLKQILFMDGPMHARLRAVCMSAFSPRRIELMRQTLRDNANALLDGIVAQGEMDLVSDFARPFPAFVLATLLGLPTSDGNQLRIWGSDVSELLGNFEHDQDRVSELLVSLEAIRSYMVTMVTERRGELYDGVLSALLEAEVDGARLTPDEIVANAILVVAGGFEESANLIGCGMYSLFQRPEQFAQMRDHPEIHQSAVEELLRFEAPTQQTGRLAPEDAVLGGQQIRKGDMVTVVLGAANRDPQRFPNPDRLDLTRADNRHLSFGWASHYCVGAPFSRLMGQAAFEALFRRLPGLTLVTQKPEWRNMAFLRGITSLQVEFDAQAATAVRGVA